MPRLNISTSDNGNDAFTIGCALETLSTMKCRKETKRKRKEMKGMDKQFATEMFLNHKLLPYTVYWFILWIILIFYAHVQISTRFICCSCPAFYWFCAKIIAKQQQQTNSNEK